MAMNPKSANSDSFLAPRNAHTRAAASMAADAPLALKALAASGAAVASAFIVNPFDVVKVSLSLVAKAATRQPFPLWR